MKFKTSLPLFKTAHLVTARVSIHARYDAAALVHALQQIKARHLQVWTVN
jgi:hypothetical protein